jgi:8-oxo-dGTP pyrophosphatase MutT (NUDIX family)
MIRRKREVRQFAALPFHFDSDGNPHLYLITSRGSGRWIIPKGNPIRGLPPHEVAAREALEEAGLVGHIRRGCIGTFRFDRRRGSTDKPTVSRFTLLKWNGRIAGRTKRAKVSAAL